MTDQIRRHVNGGAQKVGSEVHVSADSFCDGRSVLQGTSHVFGSMLLNGHLKDSQSFNSEFLHVEAVKGVFVESRCLQLTVRDSVLHKVTVVGGKFGRIALDQVVAENCELRGHWTLEGNARIPTGIWHRAPRYKLITGENGVEVGLTESTEGHALMACWRKPITKWLKYGPRLGIKHGWTAQQIEDARLFFQDLLDVKIEGVIPSAT